MIFNPELNYKISLKIGSAILTYTCKVIKEDETFFTLVDKFKNEKSYNKSLILSYVEVEDGS